MSVINDLTNYDLDIKQGKRFEFGKNWARFLSSLREEAVRTAEDSLREMLGLYDFSGQRFLDIGSGSGLFRAYP